jgi:hypothetical protein
MFQAHASDICADLSLEAQIRDLTETVAQLASRLDGVPEQQRLHQQTLHMLTSRVGELDASIQLLAEPEVDVHATCACSGCTFARMVRCVIRCAMITSM